MLMCKAARGDHYTFKDSLTVKDYKVQDGIAISNTSAHEISLGGSRRGRDGSARWATRLCWYMPKILMLLLCLPGQQRIK